MNFPSAYSYLEAGYPIAREGWRPSDSELPTKMLKVVNGAVCIGKEGEWQIVTSRKGSDGNLLVTDIPAMDWYVVGDVSSALLPRPDLEIKF